MIESAGNDRLVARIASGDPAAVAELHERFSPRVYFVALREMRSPADAEDVRNETMVRVLERHSQGPPRLGLRRCRLRGGYRAQRDPRVWTQGWPRRVDRRARFSGPRHP